MAQKNHARRKRLSVGHIALFGGLVLLLAWSIDSMIRKELDQATRGLDTAKMLLQDIESETRLRSDVQQTIRILHLVQLTIVMANPEDFSPSYFELLPLAAREKLVENTFNRMIAIDWKAKEILLVFDTVRISSDVLDELRTAVYDVGEIVSRAIDARVTALAQWGGHIDESTLLDPTSVPPDIDEYREKVGRYVQAMTGITFELKDRRIEEVLNEATRKAVEALKSKRSMLNWWSSAFKLVYFALFIAGTIMGLLVKRREQAEA